MRGIVTGELVAALDDEFARPDAGGDPDAVDAEGQGAGQNMRQRPYCGEVGREGGSRAGALGIDRGACDHTRHAGP